MEARKTQSQSAEYSSKEENEKERMYDCCVNNMGLEHWGRKQRGIYN